MAVEPLYNNKDLLLSKLRMGQTTDTQTLTVIDQAISSVRLGFYRRLGPGRANEIVALTSVENPTDTDGILRSQAEITEVYWVQYELVCLLPHMSIETQHAITNSFDDTPLTRDAESLNKFRACLKNSVEIGLGQLQQPVDDDTGNFSSFSTGSPNPVLIGDLFPGRPCR